MGQNVAQKLIASHLVSGEMTPSEEIALHIHRTLLQADGKNAEDHDFLRGARRRFGIPGKTLVGSDSHTPAAGSLGMLAIGLGGNKVAMAIAGKPIYLWMPEIWGAHLTGRLSSCVSAKPQEAVARD